MVGKSASVRVAILGDNSDLSRSLKDSESKLGAFGRGVAKVALAAGAAAALGLGVLAKASVDAASQAQQSLGATETVFGKYAATVEKTSSRAAIALGLSSNAYRENANVLGSLLVNQGVSADKLAGKTRGLIQTGADLAATFGGTTTEAVEALASAFKGEFDPLEKYGVSIKQAAINTEAMRVAGVDTTAAFGDLTDAQQAAAKQTATTNLLTKQTTKTQGAFAKETNTLAHQQQVLGAQWTDLKAKLGNALLPAVTNVFKALNADLLPALGKLADQYLPDVRRALKAWTKDLDVETMVSKLGDTLADIDWDDVSAGASDLGESFRDIGKGLSGVSTDGVNDGFRVFGTTVGFLADHIDLLAKAMPYIVTGFVALKLAQLANQVAGRDSLIGLGLQLLATQRLTAANRELAVAMTGVARAQGVTTGAVNTGAASVSRFGTAAKGAAGLAGLGALTVGASTSNEAVSGLMSVVGGAATGAAVGGPWGALIGGVAGAASALFKFTGNSDDAADAMGDAMPAAVDYAGSFDSITGKVTLATRALILNEAQTSGVAAQARIMGISSRELVSAVLGQADAVNAVSVAMSKGEGFTVAWTDSMGAQHVAAARNQQQVREMTAEIEANGGALSEVRKETLDLAASSAINEFIGEQTNEWRAASKAKRDDIIATQDLTKLYRTIPKDVATKINATGIVPTVRGIAKVVAKYDLVDRGEIQSVIDVTGVDTTVGKVKRVQNRLEEVGDAKPNFTGFVQSTNKFMGEIEASAKRGGEKAGTAARAGVKKTAHADLSGYRSDVQRGTDQAKTTATTGGYGVGSALKAGALSGISGLGAALSLALAGAVNQAIAAGRAAADAHSPSGKTEKLGLDLARGLVVGVTKGSGGVSDAITKLMDGVTKALDKGLAQRLKAIRKRLDGKAEAAALKAQEQRWKRHVRIVKRSLADEIAALRASGKAQDALSRQLGEADPAGPSARDVLRDLRQEAQAFHDAIKQTGLDFAAITNLDVGFNPAAMLAEMRKRLAKQLQFNAILKDLASKGLDPAIVRQLAEAGVEGGLALATGLQTGGQTAINDFNVLQGQINTAAETTAGFVTDLLFDEAIANAEAHVRKLEARVRKLEARAQRLLDKLARAIERGAGGGGAVPKLAFDPSRISPPGSATAATPKMTQTAAPLPAPISNTYQITVTAPVGASPAEIGRTITRYVDAYEKSGGRRRT